MPTTVSRITRSVNFASKDRPLGVRRGRGSGMIVLHDVPQCRLANTAPPGPPGYPGQAVRRCLDIRSCEDVAVSERLRHNAERSRREEPCRSPKPTSALSPAGDGVLARAADRFVRASGDTAEWSRHPPHPIRAVHADLRRRPLRRAHRPLGDARRRLRCCSRRPCSEFSTSSVLSGLEGLLAVLALTIVLGALVATFAAACRSTATPPPTVWSARSSAISSSPPPARCCSAR